MRVKHELENIESWLAWQMKYAPTRFYSSNVFLAQQIRLQNNPQTIERLREKAVKIELSALFNAIRLRYSVLSNLPVIFLMGPTAAGKTALAISLCEHLNTEIISVDSALVYKDMNIGTAKPDAQELARAPHHLIDLLDPSETYSVADFRRDAVKKIDEFHQQGKVPVLVGGTMLYFKALIDGLSPLPEADTAIRSELELEAKQHWLAPFV